MALAAKRVVEGQEPGSVHIALAEVDMPASYTTGGEVFGVRDFIRVGNIVGVVILPQGGFNFRYDTANDKIVAFRTGAVNVAEEEVPNATNLSALTSVQVIIFYKAS